MVKLNDLPEQIEDNLLIQIALRMDLRWLGLMKHSLNPLKFVYFLGNSVKKIFVNGMC